MFSLIVAGNGDAWEAPPFDCPSVRFGEYSDKRLAASFDPNEPATLSRLADAPALLMYEVGAAGPNVGIVRIGRVRDIVRRGHDVVFDFVIDSEHGYLPREDLLALSAELGIETFERYRTHWAMKDATIPQDMIEAATSEIPERTVESVAADYAQAIDDGLRLESRNLLGELEQFPASLEKARAMLAPRNSALAVPELLALAGINRETPEGRRAVEAVLVRDAQGADLPEDWAFSMVWFLDEYGSPTERGVIHGYVRECARHLRDVGAGVDVEAIALALWKCARCRWLVGELRREIAVLLDLLVRLHQPDGFWLAETDPPAPGGRATALAVVVLQRLGDDRYHELLEASVRWLLAQVQADTGALTRFADESEADLVATTFAMEAFRRSDVADGLSHVLTKGDEWILAQQAGNGQWASPSCTDDFATSVALGYLARRADVLPQVDGFLLMARDFFRRGEELRLEGGANNRRLSAIAIVHAVEMFLYGVFERREDLGLSAYRDNGVETLGPREALGALQGALRRIRRLSENQRLPGRDQLSSLIGRRDTIIHRAHEISERELENGISHARSFIERMGNDLLGLNLLE